MKITIYGSGCDKCKKLFAAAEEAVKQAGITAEIVKVDKVADIAKAGVLFTPGIAINDKVKSTGKIPEVSKIIEWIKAAEE